MKRRKSLFANLSLIRRLTKKFAIILLFILSFALMLLSKTDSVFIEKTSSFATDLISPVIDVLVLPAKAVSSVYESILEVKSYAEQNEMLLKENKELINVRNKMAALEIENKALTNMLNYNHPPTEQYTTARIVAEEGDGFAHSLIVYTGPNNTVKKGQVVITEKGLIGRVYSSGNLYSKVSLVTNINSKIPIQIERNHIRGMLVGDNTPLTKIVFTPLDAEFQIGDHVVTSNVAGIFPSGLPIGKIVSIDKKGIKVKLWNNLENLKYVKIVDYGL